MSEENTKEEKEQRDSEKRGIKKLSLRTSPGELLKVVIDLCVEESLENQSLDDVLALHILERK
jgi:hypothetical protein